MDGTAVILSEGCFGNEYGKTAHGLVRETGRYRVVAVIDSDLAGSDAGVILGGAHAGIPVVAGLAEAVAGGADYLVIGMAPDGGRLPASCRRIVIEAMQLGLGIDSGLHEFLSDDAELSAIAKQHGITIRDVRKPPPRDRLHFFTGEISRVKARRVAVLGTDCAVGKRTTALLLVNALREAGHAAEMIGTGQTSWLQGVRYGIMLDSIVNDFVGGELEHAIVAADRQEKPDFIVIEGQASLSHPAGAGGFEILGSARPQGIVLQHAPGRRTHSGYEQFPIAPLEAHIAAIESLFPSKVVAIGLNPEGLDRASSASVAAGIEDRCGIPCSDPLTEGAGRLRSAVLAL